MQISSDISLFDSAQLHHRQNPDATPLNRSLTENETDSIINSNFIIPDQRETPDKSSSPSLEQLHYADNLYSVLGDGLHIRKRASKQTFCGTTQSILEYLEGIQKILVTKQLLRNYQKKKIEREIVYNLQNYEETLDGEDIFQWENFYLNVSHAYTFEFLFTDSGAPEEGNESTQNENKKFPQKLERGFHDEDFSIVLNDKEETRVLGNVKLINGSYNVFDKNGVCLFQVDKVMTLEEQTRITVTKQNQEEGIEVEMGSIEIGPWNFLTLEADVLFSEMCTPKEKLLILGTVFVLMMKIPLGRGLLQAGTDRNACSVRGLWAEVMNKMKSIFSSP